MVALNFCDFNPYSSRLRIVAYKVVSHRTRFAICGSHRKRKRMCSEHLSSQRGEASDPEEAARSVVSAVSMALSYSLLGGLVRRSFGGFVPRCWRIGRFGRGRLACLATETHDSFVLAILAWVSTRMSVLGVTFRHGALRDREVVK